MFPNDSSHISWTGIAILYGFVLLGLLWMAWMMWDLRKNWTKVASIDGIDYYQNKKNPKRRCWYRTPEVRVKIRTDWVKGKTDTLE